jgi:hypothetical protein
MTSTTTVPCSYCHGGTVYGGIATGRVTCLICKGSGRIAPAPCSGCNAPILEGQERRWWNSDMFHKDC